MATTIPINPTMAPMMPPISPALSPDFSSGAGALAGLPLGGTPVEGDMAVAVPVEEEAVVAIH